MTEAKTTTIAADKRRGNRALLAGSAAFLVIGAMTAHAASSATSVSKKRTVSSLMSAALASIMVNKTPIAAPAPTPNPAPSSSTVASNPFSVGVNITGPQYYNHDRPFMNLIHGSGWQVALPGQAWQELDRQHLDSNGWVKSAPAGATVIRMLSHPIVPAGGLEIVCRYEGKGRLSVSGNLSNVSYGNRETRFTIKSQYPNPTYAGVYYTEVDATDPIRNIDCREPSVSRSQVFSSEFVANLRHFKVLRFMGWSDTNSNQPVTWSTRNRPEGGTYYGADYVPMEQLVALMKLHGGEPWFNMPWNADDEYVRKFAEYVRDNLPDRTIYVEAGNEIWNPVFRVNAQALREGRERGFSGDPFEILLKRQAQRSNEVMKIWTSVFAGQQQRLVRVIATQHANPWTSEVVLGFEDTRNWIDALATAPYFGYDVNAADLAGNQAPAFAKLATEITQTVAQGVAQKAVATRYGKRYMTYEAGIHSIVPQDVAGLVRLNADPRMYTAYMSFMTAWKTQIGGPLMLFSSVGPTTQYGPWGMLENVGLPISSSPRMQAVAAINLQRD